MALQKIANGMAALGEEPNMWGVIHGDLHQGNLLVNNRELCPIDFSFCSYAHYLYDIGYSFMWLPSQFHQIFIDAYNEFVPFPSQYFPVAEMFCISVIIENQCLKALQPRFQEEMVQKAADNEIHEGILKYLDGQSYLDPICKGNIYPSH